MPVVIVIVISVIVGHEVRIEEWRTQDNMTVIGYNIINREKKLSKYNVTLLFNCWFIQCSDVWGNVL